MSSGNFPDVLPEMSIKESNGEVSASIEETNRVRALLGLKPLNVGSSSSSSSYHSKHNNNKPKKDKNNSQQLDAPDTEFIEKLHLKLQHKHKLKTTIRGISLAEELQQDNLENYSAADWIKKSRELEKKHKKEKKLVNKHMNELYEDEDDIDIPDINTNDTTHLKGKIVNHDLSSFKSGETKILILKDSKILDDKMGINENEDELINVEMYEQELRKNKLAEIENIKRNRKYDPFDDENNNVLLPQYKEKIDITKNQNAFTLNEQGEIDSDKIIAALNDENTMDDYEDTGKVKVYDLSDLTAQKTVGTDYVVKFKKKKKKKKKKKRKRKMEIIGDEMSLKKRKVDGEDVAVELQNELEDKYAFLDDGMAVDTNKNKSRGKRDEILTALKLADIEEQKQKEKMDRYNIAIEKANKSMIENLAMNDIINELNNEDSEDDDIFNNALRRAEIIENKKIKNSNEIDKIFMENEKRIVEAKDKMNIDDEIDDEGVVVNITTQFSDGLNNVINEMNEDNEIIIKQHEREEYDIENAVIVNIEHTDEIASGGWVECDDNNKRPKNLKSMKGKMDIDEQEDDGVLNSTILEKEPLVASSISETLAHIKRRGYLDNEEDMEGGVLKASNIGISKQKREQIKQWSVSDVLKWLKKNDNYLYSRYKEKFLLKRIDGTQLLNSCASKSFLLGVIGMNPDGYDIHKFMKILGDLCGDPAPDINLVYNDDHGKPMSKKEAFRKLSHKFHGKKSGPKKEEKRIKKRSVELQMKINNNIDTPLQTLTKLKQTTKTLNKPFVVLDKQ